MESEYSDVSEVGSAGTESTEYEVRSVGVQEVMSDAWSLGSIGDSPQYLDSGGSGEEGGSDVKGKWARV